MLGVRHGCSAIPSRWLERLELKETISEVADDLRAIHDSTLSTVDDLPDVADRVGSLKYDSHAGRATGGWNGILGGEMNTLYVSALCDFEKRVAKCVANFWGRAVKMGQHRERCIFIYHYARYRYINMSKVA